MPYGCHFYYYLKQESRSWHKRVWQCCKQQSQKNKMIKMYIYMQGVYIRQTFCFLQKKGHTHTHTQAVTESQVSLSCSSHRRVMLDDYYCPCVNRKDSYQRGGDKQTNKQQIYTYALESTPIKCFHTHLIFFGSVLWFFCKKYVTYIQISIHDSVSYESAE